MKAPVVVFTSLASVALTVGFIPAPAATAAAQPDTARQSPVSCGSVISVSTRLTADLSCPIGDGLILTDGVSLNLGGHTLTGNKSSRGLTTPEHGNVTIENGTVDGWGTGISKTVENFETDAVLNLKKLSFQKNGITIYIENSTTAVNIARSRFTNNGTGVLANNGPSLHIERSEFSNNSSAVLFSEATATISTSAFTKNGRGIGGSHYALTGSNLAFTSNRSAVYNFEGVAKVSDSVFVANERAYEADSIERSTNELIRNRFLRNTTAVGVSDNVYLKGNYFRANEVSFISDSRLKDDAGFGVRTAHLEGNTFTRNGDGVVVHGAAVIQSTTAVRNTGYGIYAPRATDLGGNVAYGNGTEPQCTGVVCAGQ